MGYLYLPLTTSFFTVDESSILLTQVEYSVLLTEQVFCLQRPKKKKRKRKKKKKKEKKKESILFADVENSILFTRSN